ncbi:ABC transporter ATP-binding protein [Hondaea fermentalgiana]|uniref:ABC transporter ATP-binding protein n=1 Tax=Hondaea fermentalgiana TaxID=2315210 RepID=A0A2R5G593_9STRA|nr:ABC transporter ATP-binding protein [Hondaea fermentalgiana]|eukprot:GBG25519.1 ABC transporter ATP-binding protein [Hondaea fermentalgiana]
MELQERNKPETNAVVAPGESLASVQDPLSEMLDEQKEVKAGSTEELHPFRPLDDVSWISRATFSWFWHVLRTGHRREIKHAELARLEKKDDPNLLYERFVSLFEHEKSLAEARLKTKNAALATAGKPLRKLEQEVPMLKIMMSMVGWGNIGIAAFLSLLQNVLSVMTPFMSKWLIESLAETSDAPDKARAGYAVGLIVLPLAASLCQAQAMYISKRGSQHLFAVFTQAIFNKALHLSSASRNESSSGQIVNLMSTDAGSAMERAILLIYPLFIAPPLIAILLYLLYREIGISTYAGLGCLVIIMPINVCVFVSLMRVYQKIIVLTDERIKLCNEAFQAIRVLKMYAWERPFMKKIAAVRSKELEHLMKHAYLFAIGMNAVFLQMPYFIQFFAFTTYFLLGNAFLPWSIFTAIQLLQVLRQSFTQLPSAITQLSQTLVAQRRIKRFLLLPELSREGASLNDSGLQVGEMRLENATFKWGEGVPIDEIAPPKRRGRRGGKRGKAQDTPAVEDERPAADQGEVNSVVLHDISIEVPKATQTAVVSAVGSGKSSLLAAMIGELEVDSGSVRSNGRIAYAPQQPWIISATIRENILFGNAMESARYKEVIKACSLRSDLKLFPEGDMAFIGERGLNLSGGQKARISLARAVYADADIVLLDNPLSAVDSHVGAAIFKNCICGPLLKGKTLIWVTNQLDKIKDLDNIIVLHEGRIVAQGKFPAVESAVRKYLRTEDHESSGSGAAQTTQDDSNALTTSSPPTSQGETPGTDEQRLSVLEDPAHPELSEEERAAIEEEAESAELETLRLASTLTTGSLDNRVFDESDVAANNPLYAKEQEAVGTLKFSVLVWFVRAAGSFLFTFAFSVYILYLFTPVFSQYILQWWTDEVLACYQTGPPCEGRGDYFWYYMYLMLFVVGIVMVIFAGFFIARARVASSRRIHDDLLRATFASGITDFFDVVPMGRILNRFSKDITTIDVNLSQMLMFGVATLGFTLAAFLGLILGTSGLFGIVVLPCIGAYALVYRYTRKSAIQLQRLESTSRSPIYSQFSEVLNGLKTVRAFQQETRFKLRNRDALESNMRAFFLVRVVLPSWLMVAVNIFGVFITGFTTLFILTTDLIAAGQAALALTYAITITQTLNATTMVNTEMEVMMNSVERIKKFVDDAVVEDPILRDAPLLALQDVDGANALDVRVASDLDDQWPSSGRIEMQGLVIGYRKGPDVLHGVSLTIEPGEKIGVCGRTGSGKSTLLSALLRIVEPRAGTIVVDGVDIRNITLEQLRSRMAIIPQDPVCFIGTIRLNLDPFEDHSDEAINECLRQVQLEQWVGKLDTPVAEGGENISVGQRQMICFGRAILRQTKVLLVDEATAHLDAGTDDLIQKMVREVFRERTTITIAHRLQTILDSTRILVMENGLIGEFDTPDVLTADPDSRLSRMLEAERSKGSH